MARKLGEIVVAEGMVTAADVDEALQAQVLFGGRLGTNLVELGRLDLDSLTRALSLQMGVPGASQEELESVPRSTLALLPTKLVEKHLCVPLSVASNGRSAVIAFASPGIASVDEVAFTLNLRVQAKVAPELRILHWLERYYSVARKMRYLRLDSGAISLKPKGQEPGRAPPPSAPPQTAPVMTTSGSYEELGQARSELFGPSGAHAWDTAGEELPSSRPAAPSPPRPIPPASPRPKASPAAAVPPQPSAPSAGSGPADLAPVQAPPALVDSVEQEEEDELLLEDEVAAKVTVSAASARIAAALDREQIADALVEYLRSRFGVGLVLMVRQEMALGWRGHAPGVEASILESITFPLQPPSFLQQAYAQKSPLRLAPPPEGRGLQDRFFMLLRCEPPAEVFVAPILIRDRVVSLIYAQTPNGAPMRDGPVAEASALAIHASTGFVRLIQKSKSSS